MSTSIPQTIIQCSFNFEELDLQPIEDVILQVSEIPPDKKFCPICEQWLDRDCFGKQSRNKEDGLRYFCKSCRHDCYIADLEKDPEFNKKSAQRQRELFLEKSPEEQEEILTRTKKNKRNLASTKKEQGLCARCLSRPCVPGFANCEQCRAYLAEYDKNTDPQYKLLIGKDSRDKLRGQVISNYGGICVECGESNPAFLSVDHVNNDGSEHRRSGLRGHRLYQWLRQNSFPQDGFQLLCHNCNWFKLASSRQPSQDNHAKLWRDILRQETFSAYGGKCACCGEDRLEVLTIDHINGGGNKHRREIGRGGVNFYKLLRDIGFPQDEYQALCHNCNQAKHIYGTCPHQTTPN